MAGANSQGATRRVLVTGGAGFIGSHITDALLARGMLVRVLDNFATGRRDYVHPAAELVEADIRDAASMRAAFADIDTVFHVAARPRIMFSIEHPLEAHLTNVVGTLNVLMAARAAGVRRMIYSGSSAAIRRRFRCGSRCRRTRSTLTLCKSLPASSMCGCFTDSMGSRR
jgi:UDP-glucose 4-epimerase